MIKKIEVLNYKALKYISVSLSNLNVLIGPNGSGKSTFIDVLNLVKDVLNSGPNDALKKRVMVFEEALWRNKGNSFEIAIEFSIPMEIKQKLKTKDYAYVRYEISIARDVKKGIIIDGEGLWFLKEEKNGSNGKLKEPKQPLLFPKETDNIEHILRLFEKRVPSGWKKIISKSDKGNDYFRSETTNWNIIYKFGPAKSSLARVPEDEEKFPVTLWVKNVLMEGIQFLQLNSNKMKWACSPDVSVDFDLEGSNLPKVVQYLQKTDEVKFNLWIEHLKTILPDLSKIKITERIDNRFLYLSLIFSNGIEIPSWLLSDGTLRLIALTLIPYLPEKYKIYMIEEPENGLHPLAIESVYQSLSSVYENQVFLATHSPALLRLVEPKNLLCFAKNSEGAVDIIRGDQHPNLVDWQKGVDISTLHASGVLG